MALLKYWNGTAWAAPSIIDLSAYARKDQVPSIEETLVSVVPMFKGQAQPFQVDPATVSVGRNCPIFTAPYPLIVLSCDVVINGALTASASNYWQLKLRRHNTLSDRVDIVTKNLDDGLVNTFQPINFDSDVWDAGNRKLGVGQTLAFWVLGVGSPPDTLEGPMSVTVRYARQ